MTATQLALPTMETPKPMRYAFDRQMRLVIAACGDGVWRSLREMEAACQDRVTQASISARTRDLRQGKAYGFEQWSAARQSQGERKNLYRIFRRESA